MIKHTFLILCLFVGLNTVAQNRLEFNQVINITKSEAIIAINNPTVHYSPTTDTIVPAGKVWKVVKANTHSYENNTESTSVLCARFLLNDNPLNQSSDLEGLWLDSGTKLSFFGYCCTNYSWTAYNLHFYISIIEYNIIPD
jgi:hypothetical protein